MRARTLLGLSVLVSIPGLVSVSCVDDGDPTPAASLDAAALDVAVADSGASDTSTPDTSTPDTSTPDTSTPDDAGVDAADDTGTVDASVDAADAADANGPQPGDVFVNATTGSDSATGAQGDPFKTLTKAMATVTAGHTVWLEDGTWTPAIDAPLGAANAAPPCSGKGVVIPVGVAVRAVNPGNAIVSFNGSNAFCTTGAVTLSGFEIHRTAGGGVGLYMSGGTSTIDGVLFSGVTGGYDYDIFDVVNGAKVTMTPGGRARYVSACGAAVVVKDTGSELTVTGGAFDDAHYSIISRASHLQVTSGAKLVLTNVDLARPATETAPQALQGIYATDSTVELRGTTKVHGFVSGTGLFIGYNTTVLVTDSTEIYANPWGIFLSGWGTAGVVSPVTLSGNASVHNNTSGGIRGDYVNGHKADLTIAGNASVSNNTGTGIEYSGGTFTMTGGSVNGNSTSGIIVATALTSFSMHNASVVGNPSFGLRIGAFTGTADLGTKASPGNNTITGASGNTNIRVERDGVTAVGNTWDPNVQGTDAMGKVPSPDGGIVEITGPVNGKNFQVVSTGHKLRIAEP